MCRFFSNKNIVIGIGSVTVLLPLIIMSVAFSKGDDNLGSICAAWFIGSLTALGAGYYVGSQRKCQLAHLPENVEVEAPRAEGEPEDVPQIRGMRLAMRQ